MSRELVPSSVDSWNPLLAPGQGKSEVALNMGDKGKSGPDWVQLYNETNEKIKGLNDKSKVGLLSDISGGAEAHADAETEAEVRGRGRNAG